MLILASQKFALLIHEYIFLFECAAAAWAANRIKLVVSQFVILSPDCAGSENDADVSNDMLYIA